jgi:hypothetical protein
MDNPYEISTQVGPIILNLQCTGIIGGRTLVLEDASKMLTLKYPVQLWPWIEPGDLITMLLSPTKITVTPSLIPTSVINSKVN